jgi:hypothetical protein
VAELLSTGPEYYLKAACRATSDDVPGEALIPRIVCSEALL